MIFETGSGAKPLAGCVGGLGPNTTSTADGEFCSLWRRGRGRSVVTTGARPGCVRRPHVTVAAQGCARQATVGALGSAELGTNVPTAVG
jgi:hypothetical protein